MAKMQNFPALFSFFALIIAGLVEGQRNIVVDKYTDLFESWHAVGGWIYYTYGYNLDDIRTDLLPAGFNFKPFRNTEGIWAIFPDNLNEINYQLVTSSESNKTELIGFETTVNTTVSFSFHAAAQLMDSVKVRYCLYGKARILVKKGFEDSPVFTIAPVEPLVYEWEEKSVALGGTNKFVVEAHVESPRDFVFIDKITGVYFDVTTTTTRRPSSSHRTHAPKSGENSVLAQTNKILTLIAFFMILRNQTITL